MRGPQFPETRRRERRRRTSPGFPAALLPATIWLSLEAPEREGKCCGEPYKSWTGLAAAVAVLAAAPVFAQMRFSDVPEDHSRRADIDYAADRGRFGDTRTARSAPTGTYPPTRSRTF